MQFRTRNLCGANFEFEKVLRGNQRVRVISDVFNGSKWGPLHFWVSLSILGCDDEAFQSVFRSK